MYATETYQLIVSWYDANTAVIRTIPFTGDRIIIRRKLGQLAWAKLMTCDEVRDIADKVCDMPAPSKCELGDITLELELIDVFKPFTDCELRYERLHQNRAA